MKKFVQIIVATLLSVTFVGAAAGAQSVPAGTVTCEDITIVNTGNNNENNISCTTVTQTTITCTNNIIVGNVSFQDGESGSATGSGTVNSGTVVNYNGTQTTVGASCGATTTTSPSPSPSPSSSVTPTVKAASLPNTANSDTASIIALSLAVAAGVVAFSRIAVAAYRHIGNK